MKILPQWLLEKLKRSKKLRKGKTNFSGKALINDRYIFIPKGTTIYFPVEKDEKIDNE